MGKIQLFWKKYQFPLIALSLAFFVHLTYLRAGFVWIDHNDLQEKQAVVQLDELATSFVKPFGQTSFYRPVVVIVNSIDYALYRDNPFGYHLTNLLLHMCVVLFLPIFLSKFIRLNSLQKFLSQILIAIHPMSIVIVGALTRRQETLGALFIMLSFITYANARLETSWIRRVIAAFMFFIALSTKETALVVIPGLIVIWEVTQSQQWSKKSMGILASELCVILLYAVLRMKAVPNVWNIDLPESSMSEYLGTRIGLVGKWFIYAISPLKPNISDAVPRLDLLDVNAVLIFVILCTVGFFIIKHGYKKDLSKVIFITMLFITPGLALVPVPRIGTPNYGYLPALGCVGGAVILWHEFKKKSKAISTLVLSIWVTLASATTFISGDQFKNDLTLFKPEVEAAYFPEGHYFLGNYYLLAGEYELSKKEYLESLKNDPSLLAFRNDRPTKINLASALMQEGNNQEARVLLNELLETGEGRERDILRFNLALSYYNEGEYLKAIEVLQSQEWTIKKAYLMLSDCYDHLGKQKEKEAAFNKADSLQ